MLPNRAEGDNIPDSEGTLVEHGDRPSHGGRGEREVNSDKTLHRCSQSDVELEKQRLGVCEMSKRTGARCVFFDHTEGLL